DIDLNRGIVQGLPVLQVAQRRDAGEFVLQLPRKRSRGREIRTHHRDLHRSRCTEVHDAADDVAGLEGELSLGEALVKGVPEFFLNNLERWRVGTKSDLENAFVRAAGPEKDSV